MSIIINSSVLLSGFMIFTFLDPISNKSNGCNGFFLPVHNNDSRSKLGWLVGSSCSWRSIDQFILVSGSPLGPLTRFYLFPSFDNYFVVLPVMRPLWREDGSVACSTIGVWSGHWGPITTHYCLTSCQASRILKHLGLGSDTHRQV
jgi:hypothetical protein